MLILEGPDNSGKTMLAKKLCERHNLEYCRPPTLSSVDGANRGVADWWDEQLENPKLAVYDRTFYISDTIYRSFHPQDVPIRGEERMCQALDAIMEVGMVIFCAPMWSWSSVLCQQERLRGEGLKYTELFGDRVIHWTYRQYGHLVKKAWPDRVLFYRPDTPFNHQVSQMEDIDVAINRLKEEYI